MTDSLRILCSTDNPPFQAAKWLSMQMLLDPDEMIALFEALGPCFLYRVGAVCKEGQEAVLKDEFLMGYRDYIDTLKRGELPDPSLFRRLFAIVITATNDALYALRTGEGETIVRVASPVIQVQPHSMHYSTVDHKFRPMLFGLDTITWGVQFSYPQIFQDQHLQDVRKVENTPEFPNTALFRTLQQWQREHTMPTPFRLPDGNRVIVPMRIGKRCLNWINRHQQLARNQLEVIA